MKLTEAKIKKIIFEEVTDRLIEIEAQKFITVLREECKKQGLLLTEQQEEDEIDLYKKETRRGFLKKMRNLGLGAAALGLGGAWIDSQIKADAAAQRADPAHHSHVAAANKAAAGSLGDYEGPDFGTQRDYFSNLDFAGAIKNINSLPDESTGAEISQFRVAGLPNLYISAEALLDKPIPKMKANSGKDALEYYRLKYDGQTDKPKALQALYKELVSIGQIGGAGIDVAIVVNDGGKAVRVLPPEWSILFHFVVQEADKLSQNDLFDFKNRIYDMELDRYYNTVDRGKQEALDKGYETGTKALKASRADITPEQYRGAYPKDTTAKYGKYFFDIGFIAATAGEEKPEVPR
jgi:hypothetical protein